MAYKGSNYGLRRATSAISLHNDSAEQAKTDTFYTGGFNTKTLPLDPLITGYAFIKWIRLPSWFTKTFDYFPAITEKNLKSFQGNDDIEISPVGVQIGFTGNESQFSGAIGSKGSGFTMSHNEYAGSPIIEAYNYWVSSIRDPHSGIATYPSEHGVDYAARNHTGELLYVQLKPSAGKIGEAARQIAYDIEDATYYTNVQPLKIQRSHLNFQQGSQEGVTVEQSFTADRWFGAGVLEYAAATLSSFASIACLQTENVGNFGAE